MVIQPSMICDLVEQFLELINIVHLNNFPADLQPTAQYAYLMQFHDGFPLSSAVISLDPREAKSSGAAMETHRTMI